MDQHVLINGLMYYLGLVILLTFHEFGHAWVAMKCGDDTAKDEGRCSLNPLVHLDPIGTGLIPLLQIFHPAMGAFLLGWAKPVPVNLNNLRYPKRDDILISMAGPAMNLVLAIGLMAIARICLMFGYAPGFEVAWILARLSLLLCFFNLLPIPPLDGSHVMRVLVNMDYVTYIQIAQYGFMLIILMMMLVPWIMDAVGKATNFSLDLIAMLFGM